ncbi:mothers against decapentaplegic homolog 6-like [Paramacrobiotus metropolitanus]|uniref:mothers against decapentaplegic homolog 6-like n=1 Tax=Paramacrobiotus metropolitanus TaxID=2943436 RepID=UPI002445E1E9|nr:mothers against decapentaplegic homolog 6-like [Paramacrobiotus metropolitanus]
MFAIRYFKRKIRLHALWNLRARECTVGCDDESPILPHNMDAHKKVDDGVLDADKLKKIFQKFCCLLTDHQLKQLHRVVEGKGAGYGECIMLPRMITLPVAKCASHTAAANSRISPLLLTSKVWRWKDLQDTGELTVLSHVCPGRCDARSVDYDSHKCVPDTMMCATEINNFPPEIAHHLHNTPSDSQLECCNPYHWARQTELPPSASYHLEKSEQALLDLLPSQFEGSTNAMTAGGKEYDATMVNETQICSTETRISYEFGGQPSIDTSVALLDIDKQPLPGGAYINPSSVHTGQHHWCSVKYWEEGRHESKQVFRVVHPVLNVFNGATAAAVPDQVGLSLEALGTPSGQRSGKTLKLRQRIGLGFCLIRDERRRTISIYNRTTDLPLFVSSRYLESKQAEQPKRSAKVLPGYSVTAFDLDYKDFSSAAVGAPSCDVPNVTKCSSIFVSFGKGFGLGYSRVTAVNCPCMVEICLDNLSRKRPR